MWILGLKGLSYLSTKCVGDRVYAVPFQSVNKLHLHASATILGAKLLTSFVKAGLRIIFEWWPDTTSKKFVLGQVLFLTS